MVLRLLYLLCFTPCILFCQNVDSLKILFQKEENVNAKHLLALQIVEFYDQLQAPTDSIIAYASDFELFLTDNPNHKLFLETKYHILSSHYKHDSVLFFQEAHDLIQLAKKEENHHMVGKTTILLGGKYRVLAGFTQGIEILSEGLKYIEPYQDAISLNYQARICSLISGLNTSQGNLLEALKYGLKVQEIASKVNNQDLMLRSYFNLGVIYGTLSSEDKKLVPKKDRIRYKEQSIVYQQLAYDFCKDKKINRSKGMATYNLGLHYSMSEEYSKSKPLLYEAIKIGKTLPWNELLFNAYDVLSEDLIETGKVDSGYYYIKQGEELSRKMNSPYHILSSGYSLGKFELLYGDINKARAYTSKALKIAKNREISAKERIGYDRLYQIEKTAGNFETALNYFTKHRELTDSISGENHLKQINKLKAQFDHAEQKAEIEILKNEQLLQEKKIEKKNGFISIAILGGLLISSLIYFLYREKSLKAQKREIIAQQKLLRTQLNPHFLFNALNAIQQYIYLQKEPKQVADYLAKFSRLTRRILQNSNKELIGLSEEIDFLKDYMDLQKLRFDIPFEYSIIVNEELLNEEVKIPPMFTQPFVENSIEHGILNKKTTGKIEINFEKTDDLIMITLQDNGVGISKTLFREKNQEHRSLAIGITKERLKSFDTKFRKRTDFIITDLAGIDETITGTKVILKLPILY